MTTAIQPYRGPEKGALVQFVTPGVAAEIRLDGRDGYELRLASVDHDLSARLVVMKRNGEKAEFGAVVIERGSAIATHFGVGLLDRTSVERIYFVISDGSALYVKLEAPKLPVPMWRRAAVPLRVAGAMVFATAVAGGSVALAMMLPQQPVLVGPSRAIAGDVVRVGYATHGAGTRSYAATLDDGTAIARGTLRDDRGDIAIALPRSAARHRIDLQLIVRGPFGAVSRVSSFPIVMPSPPLVARPAPIARIAVFTAHREWYAGVDTVLMSYLAVADGGVLTVTDARGRSIARAPFSHVGTQRLAVAGGFESTALFARLDVRRATTRASATVGLPAAPLTVPVQQPMTAEAPRPDEPPASASDGTERAAVVEENGPIAVTGRAVAGQPFAVLIRVAAPSMRLRLEDDAGNAVSETFVPQGATRVFLRAPGSSSARTYYLTCSYGNGIAQEVVVRSVRVSVR